MITEAMSFLGRVLLNLALLRLLVAHRHHLLVAHHLALRHLALRHHLLALRHHLLVAHHLAVPLRLVLRHRLLVAHHLVVPLRLVLRHRLARCHLLAHRLLVVLHHLARCHLLVHRLLAVLHHRLLVVHYLLLVQDLRATMKLILRNFQSPGDILMLTAAVRDLCRAFPDWQVDVRTSCPDLWKNNPYLTPLSEEEQGVRVIDMHYPLIHKSNTLPYHFIHGFRMYLEEVLKVKIPAGEFKGDVHLSDEERDWPTWLEEVEEGEEFWIVVAGGKLDFTAKWWDPNYYQIVIDHFRSKIRFVQVGCSEHFHYRLRGVVDLIDKTSIRQLVQLMYHAAGVLCPVTFAMHLAAAVPTRPGRPRNRPCVVVAGGREPPQWEAYPYHRYLAVNGALPCCDNGGCWKSRCTLVGDGDEKDFKDLCVYPVTVRSSVEYPRHKIAGELRIPRCMRMVTPGDVIRAISLYLDWGNHYEDQRAIPVTSNKGGD